MPQVRSAQTKTGNSGSFAAPNLAPGSYQITVTRTGFTTASYDKIQLTVGQALVLNCTLEVGPLAQAISVAGDSVPP